MYNPPVGLAPSTPVKPATKTHLLIYIPSQTTVLTHDGYPASMQLVQEQGTSTSFGWPAAPLPGHHHGCLVASTLTLNRSAHKKTQRALSPSSPSYKTNKSPNNSLRVRRTRSLWKQPFRIATDLSRALEARLNI
jgi:hypothetical protein